MYNDLAECIRLTQRTTGESVLHHKTAQFVKGSFTPIKAGIFDKIKLGGSFVSASFVSDKGGPKADTSGVAKTKAKLSFSTVKLRFAYFRP